MSDVAVLDVDDSQFQTLLSALPASARPEPISWIEDELHPYTADDRLRDARYCWLLDHHGPEVARLWMDEGCPVPFKWTEIISGPKREEDA